MRLTATKRFRWSAKTCALALGYLFPAIAAGVFAIANAMAGQAPSTTGHAVVDDWSHHRLIFSNPGTLADAVAHGRVREWLRATKDPRFQLQRAKREAAQRGEVRFDQDVRGIELSAHSRAENSLGRAKQVGAPSGDLPRGSVSATTVARLLGVPLNEAAHKHNRHPEASSALNIDWSQDMGSGAMAGIGVSPAKFSFTLNAANCGNATHPDFVVFNTSVAGAAGPGGQASIIAYDNLYTGSCTAPTPAVYWAYNTGGTISTSVILSPDGSQVAFAQTSGGIASLVILKWAASGTATASNPATLSLTPASGFRACTAPCMTTISFSGGANDSGSAPFYDYSGTDLLYIGDDAGKLHQFSGVFSGTPGEVTSSPWPVSVGTQQLGGPVLDGASGKIFVSDYSPDFITGSTSSPCGLVGCGVLHSISAATGAVSGTSSRLDSLYGIVDSPIVDSSAGKVYAFAGADGSASCTLSPCSGVYQFPTGFTSGSGTEAKLGAGFLWLLAGSFDNAYFTSANSASPTGHLYVSGNTGLANNTLYQVAINSGVMSSSAVTGPQLASNFLPNFTSQFGFGVTEIANGVHDFIFVSVADFGSPAACANGGCVIGYDVASGTISGSTTPAFALAEAGGTSAIVIDNTSSQSGAANIYFTTLANQACGTSGTGGCAVQTSQ